jgi:polyhydroxyalkanoate synthesis regulator phasin
MPQPKSSRTTSAQRSAAAKKGAATRARTSAKRSAAAKKGAATRKKAQAKSSPADVEFTGKNVAQFRELLSRGVISPLNLVLLTRERIQEALDETVERGRMTRDDANELVSSLVRRGRKQTDDVLSDLEQLLGRSREQLEGAARSARKTPGLDRALREVDKARRTAGVGPNFPVLGYDDLSAAQVTERLADLTPAELRKVRDHERRHANRKTVLDAIEQRLS